MVLIQKIIYNAPYEYFAGFLQNLCKDSGLKAQISQTEGFIELKVDQNDNEALQKFGKLTQKYLPHSIFFKDVETLQSDGEINPNNFKVKNYNLSPCPKCLELLNDPSSSEYLNDNLTCVHYGNSGEKVNDYTNFSPHYSQGNTLLVTDAGKVDELFYMTENEKKALFSIEKPTLKVTIKDSDLIAQTKRHYIEVKSAPSVKSLLVALNAKESGISYLFFNDEYGLHARVIQDDVVLIQANALENLKDYSSDVVANRFFNIKDESGYEDAIGAYFDKELKFKFLLDTKKQGSKNVVSFKEFDLNDTIAQMKNDEIRTVLLKNFEAKFHDAYFDFIQMDSNDIFKAIAAILELKGGYEAVSEKALEYRGSGGVKLDVKIANESFDTMNFLASIISFKLAGTTTAHIAYSVFESLADLGIDIMNQLKQRHEVQNFIVYGELFESSVFYSRIKSKFAMNNPYFAKAIGLS